MNNNYRNLSFVKGYCNSYHQKRRFTCQTEKEKLCFYQIQCHCLFITFGSAASDQSWTFQILNTNSRFLAWKRIWKNQQMKEENIQCSQYREYSIILCTFANYIVYKITLYKLSRKKTVAIITEENRFTVKLVLKICPRRTISPKKGTDNYQAP